MEELHRLMEMMTPDSNPVEKNKQAMEDARRCGFGITKTGVVYDRDGNMIFTSPLPEHADTAHALVRLANRAIECWGWGEDPLG